MVHEGGRRRGEEQIVCVSAAMLEMAAATGH
jgi:hypothetical protein